MSYLIIAGSCIMLENKKKHRDILCEQFTILKEKNKTKMSEKYYFIIKRNRSKL